MNSTLDVIDLVTLSEGCELECKAAQGRDGRGELPEDFWKSYCAMANSDGGVILLGVQEKPRGVFHALGIRDIERVRKSLWDALHNRQKISANLLAERDVMPVDIDGKSVLRIRVPRASRQVRPVHLGNNPFGGSYLRRHEGDYQADDESVRRMMAERVEESRDDRVLKGYDFNDLDMETVAAYRNRFSAVKPGHVWTDLPLPEFLTQIGAWGKNREEGFTGLRLAGLLMFGRADAIRDAFPHYMVDYQERPEPKAEPRWIDRIVPDGMWSGNVYDFFRKVYPRLTANLKVPFHLQEGQRVDDTPVHEALREALVNTLIHADYSGRVSVLVVKRPDMFGFRNPGRMRIPLELAVQGSHSDCRNRRLQTMFTLVGYGDHAGSGIPKIYKNWAGQHWRRPRLYERVDPEQTLMELSMSSLVPDDAVRALEEHLGARFNALPHTDRLALITAQVEGVVSHDRLKEITTDHPADLTKRLRALVQEGLLIPDGAGRGTVYFLPWQRPVSESLFDALQPTRGPVELAGEPRELPDQPQELRGEPQRPDAAPEVPSFRQWPDVPPLLQAELLQIAAPVRDHARLPLRDLHDVIVQLCAGRYLGRYVIAHVLNRNADDLGRRILRPMVTANLLKQAYPTVTDPRQAYTSVSIGHIQK